MIMSRFSLGSLVAVAVLLAAAHGFTTTTNTPTRILHNNNIKLPPASHLHLHNDCHPSCTRTVLYSSSTVSDQHESSILEQARRVLATMEDDAEYQSHYHPYKDEDEQLQQAQYWLQQVLNANKENDDDEAEDIAERLQRKVETFERRIAKRQGADSVVPSIALELTLAALVLVVGIFWTTLDMTQRHEVTPSNLQDWMSLAHEKGYLINMFDFGGKF